MQGFLFNGKKRVFDFIRKTLVGKDDYMRSNIIIFFGSLLPFFHSYR